MKASFSLLFFRLMLSGDVKIIISIRQNDIREYAKEEDAKKASSCP